MLFPGSRQEAEKNSQCNKIEYHYMSVYGKANGKIREGRSKPEAYELSSDGEAAIGGEGSASGAFEEVFSSEASSS